MARRGSRYSTLRAFENIERFGDRLTAKAELARDRKRDELADALLEAEDKRRAAEEARDAEAFGQRERLGAIALGQFPKRGPEIAALYESGQPGLAAGIEEGILERRRNRKAQKALLARAPELEIPVRAQRLGLSADAQNQYLPQGQDLPGDKFDLWMSKNRGGTFEDYMKAEAAFDKPEKPERTAKDIYRETQELAAEIGGGIPTIPGNMAEATRFVRGADNLPLPPQAKPDDAFSDAELEARNAETHTLLSSVFAAAGVGKGKRLSERGIQWAESYAKATSGERARMLSTLRTGKKWNKNALEALLD